MDKDQNEPTIYKFIDMKGIKKYLSYYPHLSLILEFLILHIEDYVKNDRINLMQNINKSSHI
jgi:hypothetical protein